MEIDADVVFRVVLLIMAAAVVVAHCNGWPNGDDAYLFEWISDHDKEDV